jgi:hypothetical protein
MLIYNLNLFPLFKINPSLSNYFLHKDGRVYSTKRQSFKQLVGTFDAAGKRHFLLNTRYKYSQEELLTAAKQHSDWDKETCDQSTAQSDHNERSEHSERHHAGNLQEAISSRGVVIAAELNGKLVFSSNPKFHTTEQSWKDEIKRLALLNPGVRYVALGIIQAVTARGFNWEL